MLVKVVLSRITNERCSTSRMGYSHNNRIYIFDLESEEITGHIVMSDGRCFHHCMVISDTFVIM